MDVLCLLLFVERYSTGAPTSFFSISFAVLYMYMMNVRSGKSICYGHLSHIRHLLTYSWTKSLYTYFTSNVLVAVATTRFCTNSKVSDNLNVPYFCPAYTLLKRKRYVA